MRTRRARRLLATALRVSAAIIYGARLYVRLRIRLWAWRRRSARRFRAQLRGLPPGLREDLSREYRSRIENIRLPGVGEALRIARGVGGGRDEDKAPHTGE